MVERNMCDETAKLYAGTPTRGPQTLFHNTNEPSSFWRAALEAGHAEILAGGGAVSVPSASTALLAGPFVGSRIANPHAGFARGK
jgi:hypothetical protein